ncbi:MAG: peptidoglycan editing factor PgeF [Pyrinomonadaceae bacterium]
MSDEQILADSGFYWRERASVRVLVCRPLEEAGFTNGFSTRLGGVSDITGGTDASVAARSGADIAGDLNLAGFDEDSAENIRENRRRFLLALDGRYQLTTVWQVHGSDVKLVRTAADVDRTEEKFDALVSDLAGVLIGVKTADCVPILIGDAKNRAFAAVHAGWRGTSMSIMRRAVEIMSQTFGTDPADLACAIGPAALCDRYEIGQEVLDAFALKFTDHQKYFSPTREGHALVDLHAANEDQLIACGVKAANIYKTPFCTMKRTDLFFSYRVEKPKFGKTGRLMSVIGLA